MKFSGKWMELEKKIILSEVTEIQKGKYDMYTLINDISYKVKDNHATLHRSKYAKQEERLQQGIKWSWQTKARREQGGEREEEGTGDSDQVYREIGDSMF